MIRRNNIDFTNFINSSVSSSFHLTEWLIIINGFNSEVFLIQCIFIFHYPRDLVINQMFGVWYFVLTIISIINFNQFFICVKGVNRIIILVVWQWFFFSLTNIFTSVWNDVKRKRSSSTKYETISFNDCIQKNLKVMDMTAFTLCMENNLPIVVFDMNTEGNLLKVVTGEKVGTLVS